jgi:hypothetical protein
MIIDEPPNYERDHEKWSVPGLHGYRLVLATWNKITRQPGQFLRELRVAKAARE